MMTPLLVRSLSRIALHSPGQSGVRAIGAHAAGHKE
jgi:hypothetical protein